jgi:tetratricopeptide (TPR) repeat protein
MGIVPLFLIYAAVFRLSIIVVGVISIVLGYRLFCKGVWSDNVSHSGTAIEAKISETHFTVKNAAPGTAFALFGVIIISVMFVKGSPELSLESLVSVHLAEEKGAPTKLLLRGNEDKGLRHLIQTAIEHEKKGEIEKAVAVYVEAVKMVVEPMNQLAWLYQEQGELESALPLARVSVQMNADRAEFHHTLGVVLCKTGKTDEAINSMEKAAELKPSEKFKGDLEKVKGGKCE